MKLISSCPNIASQPKLLALQTGVPKTPSA